MPAKPAVLALIVLFALPQGLPVLSAQSDSHGSSMAVSQNVIASQVGQRVMADGGNAIDGAVATAFALAVVHPAAGNIGGGGFIVYRAPNGKATTIDFRECAPMAVTPDLFLDGDGNYSSRLHHDSYRAVGVPGTVAGLWLAHARYGQRPWSELLAPAVALARDGFVLTDGLAAAFTRMRKRFSPHPSTMRIFYRADGTAYAAGDRFRQPELAATLERIMAKGRDGFYRGRTADLLVAQMKRGGGLIDHKDLAGYRAIEREPVTGSYRGRTIISMPPPSSGGITLINMLNMLERYPVERDPVARLHLLAEIMRRGFADRARHLGDPDFNPEGMGKTLVAKEHAAAIVGDLDRHHASKSRIDGYSWAMPEGDQTTHLSTVDSDLGAVSMTYTLEYSYGSGIVVDGAGFLLNNEMGDFNPKEGLTTEKGLIGSRPNLVEPGKRMLSSMTPAIVLDRKGRLSLLCGTPGGRTIINTVFQIISNVVDLRQDAQAAVDLGRLHHQWFPDRIVMEESLARPEVLKALEGFGHEITRRRSMGAAECIQVKWGRGTSYGLNAGVDPRAPDGGAASN